MLKIFEKAHLKSKDERKSYTPNQLGIKWVGFHITLIAPDLLRRRVCGAILQSEIMVYYCRDCPTAGR
jgi:hypothetical protein